MPSESCRRPAEADDGGEALGDPHLGTEQGRMLQEPTAQLVLDPVDGLGWPVDHGPEVVLDDRPGGVSASTGSTSPSLIGPVSPGASSTRRSNGQCGANSLASPQSTVTSAWSANSSAVASARGRSSSIEMSSVSAGAAQCIQASPTPVPAPVSPMRPPTTPPARAASSGPRWSAARSPRHGRVLRYRHRRVRAVPRRADHRRLERTLVRPSRSRSTRHPATRSGRHAREHRCTRKARRSPSAPPVHTAGRTPRTRNRHRRFRGHHWW